ncbi:MAG: UDP-glucose 4-epimerase GalE [Magnetococcales bacterium]|nr:UDP-glucose 4-epimerase GalE [Magnetococcales bacterium]
MSGSHSVADRPTILVTGGAGFIGSHTCKALFQAGYHPVVFDNLSTGHHWAVKWGPLEHGDLADRPRIKQALKRHKPLAILHFAGFIDAGESTVDPGKYYHNNTLASLTLLEAMRDLQIQNLLFSSTAAVYGEPRTTPITENHPRIPINPYGNSKLAVEKMMVDFGQAYDLNHLSLRYFNAAGADPDGDLGEIHTPESHIIPLICQAASGQRPHIELFGQDYPTPDGTCIRDYIHVTDLAQAHVLALKALTNDATLPPQLNLGNGRGYSVLEVIAAVEKVTGRKVPIQKAPRRTGDPAQLVADAQKARKALGWHPQLTSLERMVQHAWEFWCQKELGGE